MPGMDEESSSDPGVALEASSTPCRQLGPGCSWLAVNDTLQISHSLYREAFWFAWSVSGLSSGLKCIGGKASGGKKVPLTLCLVTLPFAGHLVHALSQCRFLAGFLGWGAG